MAKKVNYNVIKTTKLSGKFIQAGGSIELDPSVKSTKDLIEKGILGLPGEKVVKISNEELEKEITSLKTKNSQLEEENSKLKEELEIAKGEGEL